ncbi:MAG: 50S ribosomal protein L31e [Euryarchaeota archaeon]|jgi:large subunit ribosomal protein L31e|nr:50S ribosomal protein L31e [Euryarchaeota archaeon]MBR95277.1 50S ribosomal protein L31e [Euryarchaeota archaeon]|tara:strand:+ start:1058 stop:1333 length:276 start_codon:yes stop_codon:yes gene_type:complete
MARPNESELIVPLRNAWNITRFKRAPRAMQIIKDHVIQHLKVTENETVYIDNSVNEYIWSRGIENPPRKVRLQVIRHDDPEFPIEVKLFEE